MSDQIRHLSRPATTEDARLNRFFTVFTLEGGVAAGRVLAHRSDLKWVAIDPLARPKTHVPVHLFAGDRLPFADSEFDFVLFVDVLHHTDAPMAWLREAIRVSRAGLVIKDHVREGEFIMTNANLRFLRARNSFRQILDNGPLLRNKFRAPICPCEWPPKNPRCPLGSDSSLMFLAIQQILL